MRKLAIAALVVGTSLVSAACSTKSKADPGPAASRDFPVTDFKRIESAGAYDVIVRTGPAPSVRAEGPQNMLERLVVEVQGDQLLIHPKGGRSFQWSKSSPVKITVTVPELHGATIAGSGTITVDKVVADAFRGEIAGSGDLSLPQVNAKTVEFEIAGSGSASLGGRADTAKYSIAGSGELDASKLQSRDIRLSIAGSGAVNAHATETVQGEILGSGEARISGGAKCTVDKMGSGSIVCV